MSPFSASSRSHNWKVKIYLLTSAALAAIVGCTLWEILERAVTKLTRVRFIPIQFLARGVAYSIKLESSRAVLDFDSRTVTMDLLNAAASPKIQGEAPLPGKANYIGSSDRKTWFTNIPTYSRVRYQDVYPGVGLAFYGKDNRLEYDFLLDPRANPDQIRMRLAGAESARGDSAGDLVLNLGKGEIKFYKPIAWQPKANGKGRDLVEAGYRLRASGSGPPEVTFALGGYDSKRPLVIDPVVSLIYSAYTGVSSSAVAVDASGNTYVTGAPGGYGYYVTEFGPTGTVIYTTSFGAGISYTTPYGLAVDSTGRAYVAGYAGSGLPTTANAYQTSNPSSPYNVFFSVLSADGSTLVYATYLGSTSNDYSYATGVAVDASGNAYLTGQVQRRLRYGVEPRRQRAGLLRVSRLWNRMGNRG